MLMNKNNRLTFILIAIMLALAFITSPEASLTGFSVLEVSAAEIEAGVVDQIEEEGEAEVIVILKDAEVKTPFSKKTQEADIEEVKEDLNQQEFEEGRDFEEINAFSGEITKEALEKLSKNPNVKKIQLDHEFTIALSDSLNIMNATKVHQIIINNTNITGENIGICILDTGLNYNHVDLSDNYADGYDFANNDNDPIDDHGHGTHVSGIATATAPNITLLHIKVLNSGGSGSESDIVAGIDWCRGNKTTYNIKAISMGIGAGEFDSYCDSIFTSLTLAINNAIADNIMIIASSGNLDGSYPDINKISAPGCIENSTAVGATNKDDTHASYSKRNSLVDILATGSDITSTSMSGGYTTMSGTSMSAPHFAGAVALFQQYEFWESGTYLTPSQIQLAAQERGITVESWKRLEMFNTLASFDDITPSLTVFSPEPINYSSSIIDLNYTANDTFLKSVTYKVDDEAEVELSGNTTINFEGGFHNLNITASDYNNNNTQTIFFGVTLPSVTLNSPEDNENDIDGYIEFNCSATDPVNLSSISLYHNLTGSFELNQTESTIGTEASVIFNTTFPDSSIFIWNCKVTNQNNDEDWGENRTLRINYNSAPYFTSQYPSNQNISIIEPQNQTFNITYSEPDSDPVSVTWYNNNNQVSQTTEYTFNGSYLTAGSYNITVFINDSLLANFTFWNLTINNTEYCGDNIKNSTEECDGTDLGGLDCEDYGFNQPSGLSCSSTCTIDSSSCSNSTSSPGDTSSPGGSSPPPDTSSLDDFDDISIDQEEESTSLTDLLARQTPEEQEPEQEGAALAPEEPTKEKTSLSTIIGATIALLAILIFIFFFLKKEWKFIKRRHSGIKRDQKEDQEEE